MRLTWWPPSEFVGIPASGLGGRALAAVAGLLDQLVVNIRTSLQKFDRAIPQAIVYDDHFERNAVDFLGLAGREDFGGRRLFVIGGGK